MRLSLFILYLSALLFGNTSTAHAGAISVRDNTVYNHKPSHNDQARIFFHADFKISPQTTITTYSAPEVLAEEREDEDITDHLYKQVKNTGDFSPHFHLPVSLPAFQHTPVYTAYKNFPVANRYLLIRVLRI